MQRQLLERGSGDGEIKTMTQKKKHRRFVVRQLANDADLQACLALEHGYATDHVWQMNVEANDEAIGVRFRLVRLPRVVQVAYPRTREVLARSWQQRDGFLVAEAEGVILGYVHMQLDGARGWLRDLVVGAPFRRKRIGSALLEQATRWALLHHVEHLTLEMQTKNYPAIQFARGHGFTFCGFDDRHYDNGDIAVFFDKRLG